MYVPKWYLYSHLLFYSIIAFIFYLFYEAKQMGKFTNTTFIGLKWTKIWELMIHLLILMYIYVTHFV